MARHKDKQDAEGDREDGCDKEHTKGSLSEKLLDVRLADLNEVERCRL